MTDGQRGVGEDPHPYVQRSREYHVWLRNRFRHFNDPARVGGWSADVRRVYAREVRRLALVNAWSDDNPLRVHWGSVLALAALIDESSDVEFDPLDTYAGLCALAEEYSHAPKRPASSSTVASVSQTMRAAEFDSVATP